MQDGLEGWCCAPMRSLRFVAAGPRTISWWDLGANTHVSTINLGAAARLRTGECVIGRTVRSEGELLFEGAPLAVPHEVADNVGAEPHRWAEIVTGASSSLTDLSSCTRLLSDLPDEAWSALAAAHAKPGMGFFDAAAELVVAAARHGLDDGADSSLLDPWPAVAAALTYLPVWGGVVDRLTLSEVPRLHSLGSRLGGPAAHLCWLAALSLERAA